MNEKKENTMEPTNTIAATMTIIPNVTTDEILHRFNKHVSEMCKTETAIFTSDEEDLMMCIGRHFR